MALKRVTSFRHLVNAATWYDIAAKLQPVGLRLNASKSESALNTRCCPPYLCAHGKYGVAFHGCWTLGEIEGCNVSMLAGMVNAVRTTHLKQGIVNDESSLCATIHWGSPFLLFYCWCWSLPAWGEYAFACAVSGVEHKLRCWRWN